MDGNVDVCPWWLVVYLLVNGVLSPFFGSFLMADRICS